MGTTQEKMELYYIQDNKVHTVPYTRDRAMSDIFFESREKALRVLRKLLTDQVEELLHRTVEVERELRESKIKTT